MIICEEQIYISYLDSSASEMISKSLSTTRVGEVMEHFHHHLKKCMMAESCGEDQLGSEVGKSIFEPGSRMCLQTEETEDHWVRDETSATWTRVIVVPRKIPYHPEEGMGGPFQDRLRPGVTS